MTAATPLTTADLNAALRLRYCQPEWALMFEVAESTGSARRYADAVAMNMFPSRGLGVHGFEVKCSRSDWLREMKNPKKAEAISQYCDYWWLVTAPGIVKDGELPDTWGLMELQGKGFKVITKAKERSATPLDRAFMAAMLRRGNEVDTATVSALVNERLGPRVEEARRYDVATIERLKKNYEPLQQLIDDAKRDCGLDLKSFVYNQNLAPLLKIVNALNLHGRYGPLQSALQNLSAARRAATEADEKVRAVMDHLNISVDNELQS